MHSILLAIKRPQKTGDQAADSASIDKWWRAVEQCENAAVPNTNVEILTAGCFLIRANGGLPVLADGIHLACANNLEYKVLFFEESPKLPVSHP